MAATVRSALRGLLFATPLIPAAALPGHAQMPVDLPEVVVSASQVPVEIGKVGSAVTVIPGEKLRASGVTTVADALREVPGLAVNQTGVRGNLTQVRIRGAEGNHVLVLIDGIQVNSVDQQEFNFAEVAIDDIERVEVVRGAQSGLYGSNAHAGVISIVTKSGKGLARPQADVRLEGGTQNSALGSASVRGAAGPIHGALTVTSSTTDGFNIARVGSERDGSRATTVSARGGIDFSPNFWVDGALRWTDRNVQTDREGFVCGTPLTCGTVLDVPGSGSTYQSFAGRGTATLSLFDGHWVQSVTASRFDDTSFSYCIAGAPWCFSPRSLSDGTRDKLDYKNVVRFDTPGFLGARHTLITGADFETERFMPSSRLREFTREQTGYFGEYLIDLPFGLSVSAAVRHDDFDGFEDATTWRVTASQRIAQTGTRIHGSAGTGITKPSFTEQFQTTAFRFVGNPNLIPERSLGWDAGIEQSFFGGRFVVDVTYFRADLEDEIVPGRTPAGISTVVNSPFTSPRQGVETTVRVVPLPWLTLEGSHTYTDSQQFDQAFGRNLRVYLGETRRPRHAASGRVTAAFADGRGRISVGVVHNGSMLDDFFPPPTFVSNRVTLDPYTVVTAQVSYDVTPQATLYARAENLFGEKYEEVFGFRSPGFAAYGGIKIKLGQ